MASFMLNKYRVIMAAVGHSTTVPDSPIAKLMFYLHCVDATVNINETEYPKMQKLTNYHNYLLMTSEDIDDMMVYCEQFPPHMLQDKVFLKLPLLCFGQSNQFYEFSEAMEKHHLQVNQSEILYTGRHSFSTKQIMVHDETFLRDKYLEPMSFMTPWRDAMHADSPRPIRKLNIRTAPKSPFPENGKFVDNVCVNVLILYFFPLWLLVWGLMTLCKNGSPNIQGKEDQDDDKRY